MAKKVTDLLATATVLLLGACSNQQTPSQTNTPSSVTTTTATSSKQTTTSPQVNQTGLDGTYMGMDESDQVTLVITGDSGTWTAVEADGEQELKQIKLDAANQIIFIGDDGYRYQLEGQQLTLKEADQDLDDQDTIVLTKQ